MGSQGVGSWDKVMNWCSGGIRSKISIGSAGDEAGGKQSCDRCSVTELGARLGDYI